MSGLTYNEIKDVLYHMDIPVTKFTHFVETGTYNCDVLINMHENFDKLYSIELSTYRYLLSKDNSCHISNIELIHGDSIDKLEKICSEINDKDTIFYLDAHQSGPNTEKSKQCNNTIPIELELIKKHHSGDKLIIINDVRLFSKYQDWEGITIQNINKILYDSETHVIKYNCVHNDRYYIFYK